MVGIQGPRIWSKIEKPGQPKNPAIQVLIKPTGVDSDHGGIEKC